MLVLDLSNYVFSLDKFYFQNGGEFELFIKLDFGTKPVFSVCHGRRFGDGLQQITQTSSMWFSLCLPASSEEA